MPELDGRHAAVADDLHQEVERLRLLHSIGLEFAGTLDLDSLLPKIFDRVCQALGAGAGSLWLVENDGLRCHVAVGGASKRLIGALLPPGTGFIGDVIADPHTTMVTRAVDDPRSQPMLNGDAGSLECAVMATAMVAGGETVGAIQVADKIAAPGVFNHHDREILEGLAASAAVAIRNARLHAAETRARHLALLLELSREITSTLDLDRVLRSVVNLAARALPFDRGAIVLADRSGWNVRALAGTDTVDPKDPLLRDLAARAEWATAGGEPFHLENTDDPATDAERTFIGVFGPDLARDGVRSALYLPLRDEEGALGALAFEAEQPGFATEARREIATILANQTAVAVRNAQLYRAVPMADTLGALAARKQALLAIPKQRRIAVLVAAAVLLAALTLIRWPLRVVAIAPAFRAAGQVEVRAGASGTVERVLVREGDPVARGAALATLRDPALAAEREALVAAVAGAERAAAIAAAQGDPSAERLERIRAAALARELAITEEELGRLEVRAPHAGVILSPRPEEKVGAQLDPGDLLLVLGRLDTLELELGVHQRDVARVRPGDAVRFRVDAVPGRTFEGRVRWVAPSAAEHDGATVVPVRAAVANPGELLRPGMTAHARVLTAPASIAERLLRTPVRTLRLLWWRIRP